MSAILFHGPVLGNVGGRPHDRPAAHRTHAPQLLIGCVAPALSSGSLAASKRHSLEAYRRRAGAEAKAIVRASIQAYFFEVLAPNLRVIDAHG